MTTQTRSDRSSTIPSRGFRVVRVTPPAAKATVQPRPTPRPVILSLPAAVARLWALLWTGGDPEILRARQQCSMVLSAERHALHVAAHRLHCR